MTDDSRMSQVLLQIIITVCAVHCTFGVPFGHLSPEMSDALHLLRPDDRSRFSGECLGNQRCSKAEVTGYSWESSDVALAARERFWHTYACMWSEDPSECPVDGGWSVWGEWGVCDTTCGDGTKMRYRLCNWPVPRNGGNECHGQTTSVTSCRVNMACPATEEATEDSVQQRAFKLMGPFNEGNAELRVACMEERCSYQQVTEMVTPRKLADVYWTNLICYKHLEGCAVDGSWSEWSTRSSCSSQCGTGKDYRSRRCNNPQPRHGGRYCQGPEYEEGPCFDDSCVEAVGVLLTPWSMWSACSSTCNEGLKTSTRRCHGSDMCDVGNGQVAAVLTREMPCTNMLCPKVGGWSEWGGWTVCTAICGQGRRMKERTCNNPRPQGEGNDCVGDSSEIEECSHYAPFCDGIPEDVQMFETWSHWSDCSAHCDGGMQIRHRTCPEQEHMCRGELYDLQMCNDDLPCQVDGGWTEWTEWSVCTVTCGVGEAERYRQCSHPRPEFGGQSCQGDTSEKRNCSISECPASTPTWESWGQWSQCTVTCGRGTNTRKRGCLVSNDQVGESTPVPTFRCIGEFKQINVCNFLPCPVDGNWASWGEWGGCSRTCGEGVVKRDRTCTDPSPAGDGEVCGGYGTEMVLCYKQPCPVPDQIVRTFEGAAFMMYRHATTPTRNLLIYIRFKPSVPNGLLALRHEDAHSDQVVSVGLSRGYVRLYAKIGEAESEVVSTDEVLLNKWNSIEVTISGGNSGLRLNDGDPIGTNFTLPLPTRLDWDQPMFLGGALPYLFPGPAHEYVGFVGAISALRVNYKEYTLHDIRPEWTGVGLPFVSFNVGTQPADIDAQVTVFTGDEFTFLPCPNCTLNREFSLQVIFRPDTEDGIILFSTGLDPGSFIALVMVDWRVTLFVNFGNMTYSAESAETALFKWTIVQLIILGTNAEMHVNGGPVVQLTAPGKKFAPVPWVNVGGVPGPDKMFAKLTTGTDKGLSGAVYGVTINKDQYLLSETALNTDDMYLNSVSTTLSAHYREVRKLRHHGVVLHCNYANIYREEPMVTWLRGDKLLEDSDHLTIFKPNIFLPHISALSLHGLDTDNGGLYACMVWYRGKAIITHAFGISVYELHFVDFHLASTIELIVMGNVVLILGIVVGIFALSCCTVCRKRFFFLDLMYQSIVFYLGLDSCACLRDPNVPDHAKLLEVNATYDKEFSAREQKIKFDQALKKKKQEKPKQKVKEVQGKRKENNTKKNAKDDVEKVLGNCQDVEVVRAKFKTRTNTDKIPRAIPVKPNKAPGTTGKYISKNSTLSEVQKPKTSKPMSSQKNKNKNQSAGVHENLHRRPSDSLSDREINLRRLSHEIVTGKPESSTSESSLGGRSSLGVSPEMVNSATPNTGNRDSLSSLVLLEGEEPVSQGNDDEEQEDEWKEEEEEPVYVNVETIRERRRQSQSFKSNVKCSKRTSLTSSDSEPAPGVASPDTRQKLLSGEPVEVDMETIRENWRKSQFCEEILISIDSESADRSSAASLNGIASHARSTQDQRRRSVAQAGHDAGRLFSHRGSIGGAVAKLSEAVADEIDGDENVGLEKIDEGAVDEDTQRENLADEDADRIIHNDTPRFDSASSVSPSDKDENGSDSREENESDSSLVDAERDTSE